MRPMPGPIKVYHRHAPISAGNTRTRPRTSHGSQLSEFAAALVLLVVFIFVPLLDLAIVPIRWMMAQELINSYVRSLALCETVSHSFQQLEADPSLRTRLLKLGGVGVQSINLHLRILRTFRGSGNDESLVVSQPRRIPKQWLPDGAYAPCVYLLEIDVQSLISPAILMPGGGTSIPGLTAPIPVLIKASHEWTNLGRDPRSEQYFINE